MNNSQTYSSDSVNLEYTATKTRNWMGSLLTGLAFTFLGIALLPLALVIVYVFFKGVSRLNWSLFTELPPPPLQSGGGIGHAIIGTLMLVAIAAVMSIPTGILGGIYLSEFSDQRWGRWIRFAANILSGVPSIIMGIFAYGVLVVTMDSYSAIAGGFALAILMLPIVVRTTDEALQLVDKEVRWASVGVGASNFHTVLYIVLPTALPGILTGTTLAVARAAGETAPLIFTVLYSQFWPKGLFSPVPSLSVLIYNFATVPYDNQRELAWAASLVLVSLVLITSVISRLVTGKQR
ncbi:phosphate ABC transporter permease PstA [Cyanothece sp. BG0011]|uniref:phosphate ABC transporter permease PstA n=1 Tax=Cyanothece sp. BG0011 TaxID=2082950 RepID=UPI000D1E3D1A|nr:phosphate ABC transporter permease PstA [Cyanothece sp. BG0011]